MKFINCGSYKFSNPLFVFCFLFPFISGCTSVAKKEIKTVSSLSSSVQGAAKSDSRQCVDNFDLLKKLNPKSFSDYRMQFDKINNQYAYYRNNEKLMESDPKEIMAITLNDKLNMVCDRVKSQTYIEIRSRMKVISKI
ncbi:hypothetical protein R2X23_03885 [Citrobacter braakii]|uniref:hypothetical protein n=1 Tax=Citrobacter braakii TaxID=57706 RepID=UPI0024E13210|nr:hypothetical protein [Citrobacter braakii]WOR25851.1 hypothetical protein R2X23_03885 [Citrobacter braakii]